MLTLSFAGTPQVFPGLADFVPDGLADADRDGREGPSKSPFEGDTDGVAVAVPVFVGDVDMVTEGAGDPPGVRDTEGVTETLGEILAVTLNDRLGVDDGDANSERDAVREGDGVAVAVPVMVGLAGTVVASTRRAMKGTKASTSSEVVESTSRLLSIMLFVTGFCCRPRLRGETG